MLDDVLALAEAARKNVNDHAISLAQQPKIYHYQEVYVMAESRGKREDDQLRLSFYRFVSEGNNYVSRDRISQVQFHLKFLSKEMNIVGMQMADLAAYPTARHVIDPAKPNPAYDILLPWFYIGRGQARGLKIFP